MNEVEYPSSRTEKTIPMEEQVEFFQNEGVDDDDGSDSSDSAIDMDTLGPMVSSRAIGSTRTGLETSRFSVDQRSVMQVNQMGSVKPVMVGNRLTKMDSIKHGVMMSPEGRSRRSGLIMTTLQEDLRQSKSLLDVCAVDNVGGELQEQWMEVYNKNVMNHEPIDPEQFDDFVWRRLILMQDVKGYLLLHHACRRKAPRETIKWFIGDDNDVITLSHRAKDGSLPIHLACRAFATFDIVQLVSKDSQGRSYMNTPDGEGHVPLDIFGAGVAAGKKNKRASNNAMTNFTEDMFRHLINDTETERDQIFQAMDSICNNCPPKKFQNIVCDNLDNQICIEWLTWAFCQPKVISSIMRDFYFKIGWTAILMHAATLYLQGEKTDAYAYALYFFAFVFFIREIKQVRRYIKAEVLVDYIKEIWNWLDITVICLVTTSATILLLSDPNEPYNDRNRTILILTSGSQLLHFASFLKKIYLPFARFVGGLMTTLKTLIPFIVCTALVLLAFAFMYHVSKYDRDNPIPPDQLQFDTLSVSFLSVFQMFIDAPEESASTLDVFFGLLTTIVLLNVVIAIISVAWDRSTEEQKALRTFWEYRLTFIQDVTLSRKIHKSAKKVKKLMRINMISDRFDQARSERIAKFHDPSHKNGVGLYFFFVMQYAVYFGLGLFTFGYLWPMKIRKDIFGIKYRPPRKDTKLEIFETRKVHETVNKRMDELETKLSRQLTDNASLVEQNQSLHKKIDHLESSINKLTQLLLTQQQPPGNEIEEEEEVSSPDIVTEVPKRNSNFSVEMTEPPTEKSRHKRVLPSGEILHVGFASSDSSLAEDVEET